jgi:hypothetical protein
MAAEEAIGTYMRLLFRDGTPTGNNFQNFSQGVTVSYDGVNYIAAAFGFSGGSFDLNANSITASVLFGLNALDLSIFTQAANGRWLADVRTTWLNSQTFTPEIDYTRDIYEVLGISHNGVELSVRLGSPLDAVSQSCPRYRLSQANVGALPSTSNISFS